MSYLLHQFADPLAGTLLPASPVLPPRTMTRPARQMRKWTNQPGNEGGVRSLSSLTSFRTHRLTPTPNSNSEDDSTDVASHKKRRIRAIGDKFGQRMGSRPRTRSRSRSGELYTTCFQKLMVVVLVSKAAFQCIQGVTSTEYNPPERVKAAGYDICVDELSSLVEGHDLKKLKAHGGVYGISEKLSTSLTYGLGADDDLLNWR